MKLKNLKTLKKSADVFNKNNPIKDLGLVYSVLSAAAALGQYSVELYVAENISYKLMENLEKKGLFYRTSHSSALPNDFMFYIAWDEVEFRKKGKNTTAVTAEYIMNSIIKELNGGY